MTEPAPSQNPAAKRPSALKRYLFSQFRNPRGLLGRLAGAIMANRESNRLRNEWTVELMDLKPTSRVLEIGFGPGVALKLVSDHVPEGRVVGLDQSATMQDMAARRNHVAIASGRMHLVTGAVEEPLSAPELAGPFDRLFAINVAMFWHEPVDVLRRLSGKLAPGGRILLTYQPRGQDQSDAKARAVSERFCKEMQSAELVDVRIETRADVEPMMTCVIGHKA